MRERRGLNTLGYPIDTNLSITNSKALASQTGDLYTKKIVIFT